MQEITGSLRNSKPALDIMEVVVVEVGEAVVVATKYLQELNVHLSNSREVEAEDLTVSMNKNVPSSAALSMNSSALQ
jgi:hypothetical protein